MSERWYQFEQIEVLPRPYWVRASSLAEARRIKDREGVPDVAGYPSDLRTVGKRDTQSLAWDRFVATRNLDRGAAFRAGFDAGVEWATDYGDCSMVKWFVDGTRAAEAGHRGE